ncbi:endothelin-converting enzyme 2-like isoform X2, partial [Paramuricea clavata]
GSAVYKAFTYYKSCMDESSIKNYGNKPVLDVIEKYGSWNITNKNWNGDSWILEKILARVLVDLKTPAFLALDIKPSFFNTSEIFVTISGGNSGYDERLVDKKKSRPRHSEKHSEVEDFDIYKDYKKLMSTVFKLLGSNSTVDEEVNRIVDLEGGFRSVHRIFNPYDVKKLRKNVKFMTVNELNNFTSFKFNWTMYFEEVLHGTNKSVPASDQKVMIVLPDAVKNIVLWLVDKPKSLLANEIIWNVIRTLINALPEAFREAQEKYIQSFASIKRTASRWKTCTRLTDSYFAYATALLFVNENLSEAARIKAAAEMFREIKSEFIDGLEEQTWMDNATRAQARLKLKKMKEWIGFPSFIKNPVKLNKFYENVQVNQYSVLQNTLSALKDQVLKNINELGKPPNNSRFLMPPLTVNAFYDPSANAMTIMAGILQPPFYKDDRLKALNYGSLGMIVGHEITHGFDDLGSEFDENGNFRQWWTKKSRENFVKRSTCLVEEYNKVQIFGYQVDGNKTLSENIADNGGLKYAFKAYQKWRDIHGNEEKLPALPFNNDQLFFIGFAQLLCAKYTTKGAESAMNFDTHSLDPVRVRVPLSNFPEFSKAFECPLPNNTCTVW